MRGDSQYQKEEFQDRTTRLENLQSILKVFDSNYASKKVSLER